MHLSNEDAQKHAKLIYLYRQIKSRLLSTQILFQPISATHPFHKGLGKTRTLFFFFSI